MARSLIGGVLVAAAVVAGCAEPGPPTLVTESVVDAIPESVWPADPALVADVACPTLLEEPVAQTTTCTATLDGAPVTIALVVSEIGAVAPTVIEPLFDVDTAAMEMASRLGDDLGVEVEVECARRVVIARAGEVVGCTARRGTDPIDFRIELLDDAGRWRFVIDT